MKLIYALIFTLIFISCSQLENKSSAVLRSPSSEKAIKKPFDILLNNGSEIQVKIGNGISDKEEFIYKISFEGKVVKKGRVKVGTATDTILFSPKKSGFYQYSLRIPGYPSASWIQDVYFVNQNQQVYSKEKKAELASLYSPILMFHNDEEYFPVTIPYILNQEEKNPALAEEVYRYTISSKYINKLSRRRNTFTFKFDELANFLPYWGDNKGVIKSDPKVEGGSSILESQIKTRKGHFDHSSIYYSVFESKKENKLYLNYHFLYAFDPKMGTEEEIDFAAHIFDRESMTIAFSLDTLQPIGVFYGAHLGFQKLGIWNSEKDKPLQTWKGGRVFVPWNESRKIKSHPVASIAKGSHGVFPTPGDYVVYRFRYTLGLKEPVGGNQILLPEDIETPQSNSFSFAGYKLIDLNIDNLSSHGVTAPLAFSGHYVDVKGRITNASFPPFTKRERGMDKYANPKKAFHFDMNKISSESKNHWNLFESLFK